ncbi:MAG TPA: hypothetical protein VHM30_15755 [Gemmatimonadaceae bacterium]|nr:hypothetical protein [Gemmatimonadaceae bacterium]
MDLYTFSLALGGVGLGVMAIAGFGHLGGHHGHAHHGGTGAHGSHGAHAGHAAHSGHHHDASLGAPGGAKLLSHGVSALISPRIVFSFLVGFGAAGLLLRPLVAGGWLLLAMTLVSGILFERLLVAPLWRFVSRFESRPALTLDSCITDEARAVSSFDARGQGLVAVELDGQLVQVLGTLRHEDRDAGVRVRAGDRLRVEDVDGARNRCTVSWLGA